MKVAIIGYGKMGREIEKILIERGHSVVDIIDPDNGSEVCAESLAGADVAVEFTTPSSAFENITTCLRCGVAVVSGTTGWTERMGEALDLCREVGGTFFYSSNYSLGVNMLFKLNRTLARMMKGHTEYGVTIEETHHIHKKDAPSGTAKSLAEDLTTELDTPQISDQMEIRSFREGEIPGIHDVIWESDDDVLTLHHSLKSRRALAFGAVMAAEYAAEHRGVLSMDDLLGL